MKAWPILIVCSCVGLGGATAVAAESCEALRSQIESKIAGAGVTSFKVVVIEASVAARGQVVGSCDLGTRKIVYQRDSIPVPSNERVLTECRDGSVSIGGSCKP